MNREILRIALPNIISNITVPLMGIVGTAIAGRCGGDSAYTIGQLAIGGSIFNMIYWNCSFIRMGTSGLTAQAFGAKDFAETTRMLMRAVAIALILDLIFMVVREPICAWAVDLVGGEDLALQYTRVRIWAVPAGIMLFATHGWFTGMQNGTYSMITALSVNIIHIALSIYLSLYRGVGVLGIAYAAVVAQWVGVCVASALIYFKFRHTFVKVTLSEVFSRESLENFFTINRDIIIRTFCIVCVYTFFTRASADIGDDIVLAVNVLLLQLFTLYSYMTDGFAYAAEALTGRFFGACDRDSLKRAIGRCIGWSLAVSSTFVVLYILFWRDLLTLFVGEQGNVQSILDVAQQYIGWIIVIPLAGAFPFLMDGVMVGASFTKTMRNSMLVSTAIYFATYFLFFPIIGNNALWLAFLLFMFLRGMVQYLMTGRLRQIYEACNQ